MSKFNKIFIGLDVSANSFSLGIIDQNGTKLANVKSFKNSPDGLSDAISFIIPFLEKFSPASTLIASESTSYYDFHIISSLATAPQLKPFNPIFFRLNPFRINRFKKAMAVFNKSDYSDPLCIAEFIRFGKNLPAPFNPNNPFLPLKKLTRFRVHIIQNIVRETNFLIQNLFLSSSSFLQHKPIKVNSKTSLSFIENIISSEQIAYSSLEDILQLIIKESRNRFKNPDQVAEKLQNCIRESFRISPELANSVNLILIHTVRNIRAYKESLKQIDKAIKEEMKVFPNTLISIDGIGDILSAGIIAEIGYAESFQTNDQIAKFAGLIWPEKQSGKFISEDRRMIKSANKYFRYYIIEAADSVRKRDVVFFNYYWKKYKEVKKHKHKRALVLTARKLIRVIFYLLKTGNRYKPIINSQIPVQKEVVENY